MCLNPSTYNDAMAAPATCPPDGELHIQLLGRFRVSVGSRRISDDAWRRSRAAALVKVLALAPDHRLHREQLMEALWPQGSVTGAANSLHQALHVARGI